MPLEKFKKTGSKRKQNGKISKMKQKYEMEMSLKESLSELDKEILSVQISEAEIKLDRRMHLCSHMEEEISIYCTLYERKRFLKSESMKLLNEAFRDFASEIVLLADSIKSIHSHLTQHFSQKRVSMLTALGVELETNWLESKKCYNEHLVFLKVSNALEEKAIAEKNIYSRVKDDILRELDACLFRLQNEVSLQRDNVVSDVDLKLDLLPLPRQALFQSGWLIESWLESSLNFQHNDMKEWEDPAMFPLIMDDSNQVLPEKTILEKEVHPSQLHPLYLYLENKNLCQRDQIRIIKYEMVNLEEAVRSLEISGEIHFEKSHLLKTLHKAGNILKQQFHFL